MSSTPRIVAVGLLTTADLERLGSGFDRVFPIEETPCFNGLLLAIDEADRAFHRTSDAKIKIKPRL